MSEKHQDEEGDDFEEPDDDFDIDAFLESIRGGHAAAQPTRDDTTVPTKAALLELIISQYLGSGDFNGLPIGPSEQPHTYLEELIRDGYVQLVTEHEFPNIHIRPWADPRIEQQLERLQEVRDGDIAGCLYPTPTAMQGQDLSAYDDQPFAQRRANGQGDLERVYLRMAAIEDYRNDPRYFFQHGDFDVDFGIGDEAYLDEEEPDSDKILMVRAGFAYDSSVSTTGPGPIHRFVCALLCDLAELTPTHQVRLQTWEVEGEGLHPHPSWWENVCGEWTDHIGPFDKILQEIKALNEIWTLTYGEKLFRNDQRHRDWGWVLRPSSNEWERFVLLTDQLMSDNINTRALDACGAPKYNDKGQPLGTLNRLETFLNNAAKGGVEECFKVFRAVRKERNRPAHAAGDPINDRTLVVRQRDLLFDLADSLSAIRRFMATHPKVRASGWTPPAYIDKWLLL